MIKLKKIKGAGKQKSTTTTTKKSASTTKKPSGDSKDEADASLVASTTKSIKENDVCLFKGLMTDAENCQSIPLFDLSFCLIPFKKY